MSDSEPVPAAVSGVIRRIPLFSGAGGAVRVLPLEGGQSLNNANWRVSAGSRDYVLRLATGTAVTHLGVSRAEEAAAARGAAAAGVAPEVLWADGEGAGHLLTPHVPGRHWEREEFRVPENVARVADALRRLHAVTDTPGGDGSVFRRVERLLDSAAALGLETPAGLNEHRRRMREIEAERAAEGRPVGLNHNDFWANNFLDDGGRLWLLDWEFAGRGDGMYDLATTAFAGGYGDVEDARLLGEYGLDRPGDKDALRSMKWVVLFFEGAWSPVMHGLRGSDAYDYLGHSRRMFERMAD